MRVLGVAMVTERGAFAISRVVHALIHLGSDYVPSRRRAIAVG